jgi:hypothetical protein
MSWEDHLEYTMTRLRSRIYMLYSLKSAAAPNETIWQVYCALLRSIASYAFPAWCNIPKHRFSKFETFERRICKLFDLTPTTPFANFCDTLASRLALKASLPDHPLNLIYDFSALRSSARIGKHYRRLKSRTARFSRSFIKYT